MMRNLRHGCSDLTRKVEKELSRPLKYTRNDTLRLDSRFRWPKARVRLKGTDAGRVVADRLVDLDTQKKGSSPQTDTSKKILDKNFDPAAFEDFETERAILQEEKDGLYRL